MFFNELQTFFKFQNGLNFGQSFQSLGQLCSDIFYLEIFHYANYCLPLMQWTGFGITLTLGTCDLLPKPDPILDGQVSGDATD